MDDGADRASPDPRSRLRERGVRLHRDVRRGARKLERATRGESAAVIYCAQCLVNQEIPLNEGCLKPIRIVVPEGTFLSPSESAAVVGGNVLTSQRVTDVCLSAFGACADSQGCMNNLTFGDETFGYYETIGGGAGAGPDWNGASGTQCHMTNTRITDPEILERRYPVALRRFGIRRGSGGAGAAARPATARRVIEFLPPVT